MELSILNSFLDLYVLILDLEVSSSVSMFSPCSSGKSSAHIMIYIMISTFTLSIAAMIVLGSGEVARLE